MRNAGSLDPRFRTSHRLKGAMSASDFIALGPGKNPAKRLAEHGCGEPKAFVKSTCHNIR